VSLLLLALYRLLVEDMGRLIIQVVVMAVLVEEIMEVKLVVVTVRVLVMMVVFLL